MYIDRMSENGIFLKSVARRIVGVWDTVMARSEKAAVHVHESYEELYYVVDGEAEVTVGDERIRVSKGDIVYVPPGVAHTVEAISELRLISVKVYTGDVNSELSKLYIS